MASSEESDEFDQAEPRLRQDAEAGDVDAAVRLAFGYDQRGRTEEAFSWGLRVVDSGDTYAMMLLTGISRSSGYLGRDQRARDRWLAEAAEQGCWDAAVQLVHSLRQQGRIAEGDWVRCGDLQYYGGPLPTGHTLDRDEQRDSWQRSAEAGDVAAAASLGKDFADEGLVEEAWEWLERAGGEAGADAMMSLAKLCTGDDRKAWLRKASDRGEPFAAVLLGDEFAGEEQLHAAQRWYQDALARGVKRDRVARDLGEVLFRLDRIDEAEQWARQAAESSRAGSPAMNLLADVLEQQGKQEEATEWRKRSQRYQPPSASISANLGTTLVAVAVFTTAVVPFVKAMVTKAGQDSYDGARAMVKLLFRRARPKKFGRRGPHGRLLIIEDPDPKLNIAIWLGTDTSDQALRALGDLDLDAIVDDSQGRRGRSIRIRWDETDKTWKVFDQ